MLANFIDEETFIILSEAQKICLWWKLSTKKIEKKYDNIYINDKLIHIFLPLLVIFNKYSAKLV